MEIFIRCTIDEETLQDGLKQLNCTEEQFQKKVEEMLKEDAIETLEDNRELFCEIEFSINKALP